MKKHLLLLSLFVAQICNAYAQNNQSKLLVNLYHKGFETKQADSVIYQKQFLKAFPSTFKTFNEVYGWNKKTNKGNPLYHVAYDHVNHFTQLTCIPQDTLIKKIIKIAVNGVYDADGVYYLRDNLYKKSIAYNSKFIKILQTFTPQQITSVWAFYFDYENRGMRKDNYNDMIKLTADKSMHPFITKGYEEAVKRNLVH